jgi:thioredoxin reductase (NADPH)
MSEPGTAPETLPETPDFEGAFPRLDDGQLALLLPHGERRPTRADEVLYRAGEVCQEFLVVLAGRVAIVQNDGGRERVVAVHGPGRFLGELAMLAGQPMFLTAVVREPGEVLAVPMDRLRELVVEDPALGDLILRAFLVRRSLHLQLGVGLQILGSRFDPETRRIREFVARNRLPHRWIDLEEDRDAEGLLRALGVSPEETPVVVLSGGQVLRRPSTTQLATLLHLRDEESGTEVRDLVVVGAGPAGLASAVYGASEGLSTVVLDEVATGGQAGRSSSIENYLGFPAGISGGELADRAAIQAAKFGAHIDVPARGSALERREGHYSVRLDDGSQTLGRAVIIATGAHYRRLDVPRLEEFENSSVYYAATEVEANQCRRDPVVVVGGGNSAGQATCFLARFSPTVHLVVAHDDLGRDMSRYLADRIQRLCDVEVHLGSEVRELVGRRVLEAVVIEHVATRERTRLEAKALFVFIGAQPHAEWLDGQVALDDDGYVLTGEDAQRTLAGTGDDPDGRKPRMFETTWPGVFAVGDVRSGSIKRVASAVGEGSMAVRIVHQHLAQVGARGPG